MKHFSFSLLLLLVSMCSVACNKDDDDNSNSSDTNLVGTYKVNKIDFICTDDNLDLLYNELQDNGCVDEGGITICMDYILKIQADGKFITTATMQMDGLPPQTTEITTYYTISGNNSIKICGSGNNATNCLEGTYSLSSGGLLKIQGNNATTQCNGSYEAQKQ
ncbi:MAG: hypothetical protein IPL35_00930 [Sphingobacteriales bacterium]|nr:hypothetical protein [Sphingobacteriales bacterium]